MQDNSQENMDRFVSLLTACQRRIYAFILCRVPRSADADDILQETTGTMWRKFSEFEPGTDFVAWGLQIARYKIYHHREHSRKQGLLLDETVLQQIESLPDESDQPDRRIDGLKKCMASLPGKQSLLIRLRYSEGIEVGQIALRLDCSVPWVYKMLTKIHLVLMRCIRRHLIREESR